MPCPTSQTRSVVICDWPRRFFKLPFRELYLHLLVPSRCWASFFFFYHYWPQMLHWIELYACFWVICYFSCQLDTSWIIKKEGTSAEELPLSDWPMGMSVRTFSWLIVNMWGPGSLWVMPSLGRYSFHLLDTGPLCCLPLGMTGWLAWSLQGVPCVHLSVGTLVL